MIGNLTYKEMEDIITIISNSNNVIEAIINNYKEDNQNGTARIQRFTQEIDNYINYLKTNYTINKDADAALEKIKELNV